MKTGHGLWTDFNFDHLFNLHHNILFLIYQLIEKNNITMNLSKELADKYLYHVHQSVPKVEWYCGAT